jgi:ATP-dependent Clp protease adaptor protein ClpS
VDGLHCLPSLRDSRIPPSAAALTTSAKTVTITRRTHRAAVVAPRPVRGARAVQWTWLEGVRREGFIAAGGEGPPRGDPEREGGVATSVRRKVARPERYKVLLYNDDYTPMEFVVKILESIFNKGPSAATQIMLQVHNAGMGVAGVYVLEVAETKLTAVHTSAEHQGYPLRAGIEKE